MRIRVPKVTTTLGNSRWLKVVNKPNQQFVIVYKQFCYVEKIALQTLSVASVDDKYHVWAGCPSWQYIASVNFSTALQFFYALAAAKSKFGPIYCSATGSMCPR